MTSARPTLPLWVAVLVAAGAGPVLDGAFPDLGWWPLAFLAIGLQLLTLQGRRLGSAFLVGFVFGATFYFVDIQWAAVFLGPVPWSALSTLMALWCGLGGMLITLAYRWVPSAFPTAWSRLLFLPVVVAGLWTLREAVASVWPYGGFSWGRVAFSQSDSPLSSLFAWIGVSGVSFLMVFLVAATIAGVQEGLRIRSGRSAAWDRPWVDGGNGMTAARVASGASTPAFSTKGTAGGARAGVDWTVRAVTVLGLLVVVVLIPAWPTPTHGVLRVGAVQGDTKAGYFDPPAQVGDNLLGQIAATSPVYDKNVDVVVWPEGASDLDPLEDPSAADLWDQVSRRAGAPLVGGTITTRTTTNADGSTTTRYFNTSLLWEAGKGALGYYDKKHPVPFGEYVPDRSFWRMFAPELIDLIQREYTPGTTGEVLHLGTTKSGISDALAGIAICFDIVDDQLMHDMIAQGADVVLAQTNNADFGTTDESVQQLAIARIRAMEMGRSVVNISTVGTSAVILPDGTVRDQLPTYTPGVIVDDVPIATTVTPAMGGGRQIEWLVCGIGIGALLAAGTLRAGMLRRRTRA
ncbi:apolipoprotein N-acyltransferase [Lysinimonas soli]|uniref:Apolipoprotein N-acyltransferase n=1 Tax=Lysinimonas soli TaxID=1074233 RepID=A0ABW0NQQ6_9MICO